MKQRLLLQAFAILSRSCSCREVRLTAPRSGCILLFPRWCCSNRWRTWWQSAAGWHCGLLLAGHSCWAVSGTGHSARSLWFWGLAGSPGCGAWAACWEFWPDSVSRRGRRARGSGAAGRPAHPSLSPPGSSGYWCHAGSYEDQQLGRESGSVVRYEQLATLLHVKLKTLHSWN